MVVEDDRALNEGIAFALRREGYLTNSAYSLREAREKLEERMHLVLLDINLPDGDGREFLGSVLAGQPDPVLLLTARDTEEDMLQGFRAGCDDYLTKPFSMPGLLRKIAAVLRRSAKQSDEPHTITYKDLTLDLEGYRVYTKQENIDLTPREFEILRELIMHQGRILTRQNLLQTLWKYEFFGEERIIHTHIKNLRKKLGTADYIETIRGVGYRVDNED